MVVDGVVVDGVGLGVIEGVESVVEGEPDVESGVEEGVSGVGVGAS